MTAPKLPVSDSKDHFISQENSTSGISGDGGTTPGEARTDGMTDAELLRRVAEALRETREQALGELQVLTRPGVITLQGDVPTRFMKLLAIKTALAVADGWCVVNCAGISVSPQAEGD